MAAVLAGGEGTVLSHRAAGQLWQLLAWRTVFGEVTRPRGIRARAGIVSHRDSLPADEMTVLDGIPVTTVPRTILDLAGVLSRIRLERAINEMEVRGLNDKLSVPDLLRRHRGRRGAAVLQEIFDCRPLGAGSTVNDFEAEFAEVVTAHGLPQPRFNDYLEVRGQLLRPDAMWEPQKLIVELDGRAAHGTRIAFERDRERDRRLLLGGWRIVRVTWQQLREAPESVAADLRELLGRTAASTLKA